MNSKGLIIGLLVPLLILLLYPNSLARDGLGSLISPGNLASPHKKYEGISNCTKCHALGGGIPDSRCLDCHDKLAARISKNEGTHSRFSDRCIKCHTDHKGKGFKIITLDEKDFDHDMTDYPLEDKHAIVKCTQCHKKGGNYSGLSRECLSCHKDVHKGDLGKDCTRCHNLKGWESVEKFNHDKDSKYPLMGKHSEVKCAECHTQGRYKTLDYKSCDSADCHSDSHKRQFKKQTCESCHITKGWSKALFDHNAPEYKGYKLDGKHVKTECSKCHVKGKYKPIKYKSCESSACHSDPHRKQFKGQICESCHVTKGWDALLFDHNAPKYTGYRLDGKHLKTECSKCHTKGKYKPLDTECVSCHKKDDTHKGELGNVCKKCHTTEEWEKSYLNHNLQTKFPLIGKHKGTECEKCHENKRYKTKAEKCIDCHKDVHKGKFEEECSACHTQFDWEPRKFDHKKRTGYELGGVHNDIECGYCHKTKEDYGRVNRYCNQCHVDPHLNQFGSLECERCHGQTSWNPTDFRHSETGFPLIGRHRNVECQECHKNRVYRNTSRVCINCHQSTFYSAPDHVVKGYGQDCMQCHKETFMSWSFKHRRVSIGCSNCHLDRRPVSHSTNPVAFSTTCEECHNSTATWTSHKHTMAAIGCSSCHLSYSTPAKPANHATNNWTTCEECHKYPTWDFSHTTAKIDCSSCHLNERPASHSGAPVKYSTTCEDCHNSTTTWTLHKHISATTDCATCHLGNRPVNHTSDTIKYPATCEDCHKSTSVWDFTHLTASSGCSSCHLSKRPASHSSNPELFPTTCENCHNSTATWTSHKHTMATSGCSSCHLSYSTPAKPANHATNNWTTCEECHKYPTWDFTHTTTTTGCSACHQSYSTPPKPASHTTNNWTTCEDCHKSKTAWTFTHSTGTFNCSACHLNYSTPAKPASHTTNNWTTCEECHKSTTSWTFSHPSTTFPLNHHTSSGSCTNCHPGGAYTNSGGCIECHTSSGEKVHKTNVNSGCLSCHWCGKGKC